jgi:hypothetical protein
MKTGITLEQLAKRIDDDQMNKRDFVADTRSLTLHSGPDDDGPWSRLDLDGIGDFAVTDHTHGQIAARLKIPKLYYDRMRIDAPDLLDQNVNQWLDSTGENRLIRTLGGDARAFLSDRYRTIDNAMIAEAILPVLNEPSVEQYEIRSANVSDAKMAIKVTFPHLRAEIPRVGDVVEAGLMFGNSEIGLGRMLIDLMTFTLACLNGMIVSGGSVRRAHLGRSIGGEDGDGAHEYFSDETRAADDRALVLKVQDTVRGFLNDRAAFDQIVAKLDRATQNDITGSVEQIVERVAADAGMNDDERGSVLAHLIRGGNLTQYGLANAVTRASADVVDYDRATQLEAAGGRIIELPQKSWEQVVRPSRN